MSMTPEQKKKFNLVFGSIFLVASTITWGMAIYFGVAPADKKPLPTVQKTSIAMSACENTIRDLGFRVETKGNVLTASKSFQPVPLNGNETVEPDMQLMTAAAAVCKYDIQYMCIGSACGPSTDMKIELKKTS